MALNIGELILQIGADTSGLRSAKSDVQNIFKPLQDLTAAIEKLTKTIKDVDNTISKMADKTPKSFNKTANEVVKSSNRIAKAASLAANTATKAFSLLGHSLSFVKRSVFNLRSGFLALGTVYGIKEIINTSAAFEGMQAGLLAVNKTTAAASKEFNFIRGQSIRLGQDFKILTKEYIDLTSATRGTSLEGENTKSVFLSIAEAGRVLQLSNEKIHDTFMAVQQIVSKGTVQAEEVRRQLGNSIPGAFRLMAEAYAKSMGLVETTTEEKMSALEKAMKKGTVRSTDILLLFAREIRSAYGGGLEAALKKANAEFGRLNNEFTLLKNAIGQAGVLDFVRDLAIELKNYMEPVRNIIEQLSPFIKKELSGFFDKKTPEEYFNATKQGFINLLSGIRGAIAAMDGMINSVREFKSETVDFFPGLTGVNKAKTQLADIERQLTNYEDTLSRVSKPKKKFKYKIDEGYRAAQDASEKYSKYLKDKIAELKAKKAELQAIVGTSEKPLVYSTDTTGLDSAIRVLETFTFSMGDAAKSSKDFDNGITEWRLPDTSKKLDSFISKINKLALEAKTSSDYIKALSEDGVAGLNAMTRAGALAKKELEFKDLLKDINQADLIKLSEAVGVEIPEAFKTAKASEEALTTQTNLVISAMLGMVSATQANARSIELYKATLKDTLDLTDRLTISAQGGGIFANLFNPEAVKRAQDLKKEALNIQRALTEGGATKTDIQKIIEEYTKVAKEAGMTKPFEGIDTSNLNEVAEAIAKVNQGVADIEAAPARISSAVDQIVTSFSAVVQQIGAMYEQQAAYHKQMAEEALSYGRSQSELYMQLADTVHYSNNEQAKAFEEKAVAAAESAAKQYQTEKEAQAKSNQLAKQAFEMQKKMQIAQAIMSTATAIMQAYAQLGPIIGTPVAIAMGALGAVQVATINQQQFTPRENGGPITGGKPYLVGEAGPELIVPTGGGTVVNNRDLMNGGGGDVYVTFNVNATDASGFDRLLTSRRGMIVNMIKQAKDSNMGRGL